MSQTDPLEGKVETDAKFNTVDAGKVLAAVVVLKAVFVGVYVVDLVV